MFGRWYCAQDKPKPCFAATVLTAYVCVVAVASAQESGAAWAVVDRVCEAYRNVYDLRFEYDAWIDYGDDGVVDVVKTGTFLFRLHEQAFIQDETAQYPGGRRGWRRVLAALRGKQWMYTKQAGDVQGILHRGSWAARAWGVGGITPLFEPLLIDRGDCVAFLVGHEMVGLRRCARVVVIKRDLVGERRYRELLAMAARGEVPEERFGANYWIDTARGLVLKYEAVAYSGERNGVQSEVVFCATRATDVRRFRSGDEDIWLPVEVEEVMPPMWRQGPVGKVLQSPGYKIRLVVVPDTVEVNLHAPDDAYVIEPPPGTRLQEEGADVELSDLPEGGPAEGFSHVVTVTRRMMEEAERQLRERGLRPVEPERGSWWRIGAFVAGAILVAVGLWFRRGVGR